MAIRTPVPTGEEPNEMGPTRKATRRGVGEERDPSFPERYAPHEERSDDAAIRTYKVGLAFDRDGAAVLRAVHRSEGLPKPSPWGEGGIRRPPQAG